MAEAMYYDKPVIATGYSSNIEFMNTGNSFLVSYDLVKVAEDSGSYKKGNIWANPNVEHTAALMHYVFNNYEAAKHIGFRGSREMKQLLNPVNIGKKIKYRVEHIMSNLALSSQESNSNKLQEQAWKETAHKLQEDNKKLQLENQQLRAKLVIKS